mmetsp:Transcript_17136/g.30758  ORF Transcript_17136/g.30758 Transcript_17136/m.30758 type:complete len:207 (-) Transcript_17136:5159-5779(-)
MSQLGWTASCWLKIFRTLKSLSMNSCLVSVLKSSFSRTSLRVFRKTSLLVPYRCKLRSFSRKSISKLSRWDSEECLHMPRMNAPAALLLALLWLSSSSTSMMWIWNSLKKPPQGLGDWSSVASLETLSPKPIPSLGLTPKANARRPTQAVEGSPSRFKAPLNRMNTTGTSLIWQPGGQMTCCQISGCSAALLQMPLRAEEIATWSW